MTDISGQNGSSTRSNGLPLRVDRPIVLIGMMGCGKSTIGKIVARGLDLPFIDADTEIEIAAGMAIADYFEKFGEAAFRRGEERVIKRLLNADPLVLATGGGAITSAATRDLIKHRTVCIWLKSTLRTLLARTAHKNTRPLLQQGNPAETLERLMRMRTPYYEQADIIIESDHAARNIIAQRVIDSLVDYFDEKHSTRSR